MLIVLNLRKARKMAAMIVAEKQQRGEEGALRVDRKERENYKKQLSDAAKGETDPRDEAILEEVREFAKQNPEITASLLRAWLRAGD